MHCALKYNSCDLHTYIHTLMTGLMLQKTYQHKMMLSVISLFAYVVTPVISLWTVLCNFCILFVFLPHAWKNGYAKCCRLVNVTEGMGKCYNRVKTKSLPELNLIFNAMQLCIYTHIGVKCSKSIKTHGSESCGQVKQDGWPLPVSYLHARLHSNRTYSKQDFKIHLNITHYKNQPF